jgi:hypothetical protein
MIVKTMITAESSTVVIAVPITTESIISKPVTVVG